MARYTEDQIKKVWNRGLICEGKNKEEFRLDAAGALIKYDDRQKDTPNSWEIDHVYPQASLEKMGYAQEQMDKLENLRPFNKHNNRSKSDSYPTYHRTVKYDKIQGKNVETDDYRVVNEGVQEDINRLFELKLEIVEGIHDEY